MRQEAGLRERRATRCTALILLSLVLLSCSSLPDYTGSGISHRLAQRRAAQISNVHYDLSFSIPAEKSRKVEGSEVLTFTLDRKAMAFRFVPLVIDFKGDSVYTVTVSGDKVAFKQRQGHILIDRHFFREGSNSVNIKFRSGNGPLNRNRDFLYTLFVPARARELFPCFDQPDLKGRFKLSLKLPDKWVAVSNAPATAPKAGMSYSFVESDPLPTYLFSFVAGRFFVTSQNRDGFPITMYYRETDPYKVAQVNDIFDIFYASLSRMEKYTGIKFPFKKYDFVILPNFQFGGMEHAGSSLFNDGRMFLNANAGTKEMMDRYSLIAHEVTHIWFGDYVTMKWFNDVWTKEVYANFFAAMMLKEVFPDVDEGINFAQYASAAYSVDRTSGTNAIQQRLDNLDDAGLLYGNIIYDKAPMVMDMLYRKCGPEDFRKSMQEYLSAFPYGNATWDQLIEIMDSHCADDLKEWSKMWVTKAGMPVVTLTGKDTLLRIRQKVAYPQSIALRVVLASGEKDGAPNIADTCIDLRGKKMDVAFKVPVRAVVPNPDARSYGCFLLDSASAAFCMGPYIYGRPQTERSSILITLNENVLKGNILPEKFLGFLMAYLGKEEDPLLFSQAMGYLDRIYFIFFQNYKEAFPNRANGPDPGYYDDLSEGGRVAFSYDRLEDGLWDLMEQKQNQQCRKSILKVLMSECYGQTTTRRLFEIYFNPVKNSPVALSENDLTQLAFELAVRDAETPLPEIKVPVSQILAYQRARITQPDRLQRFDFISQAVSPDSTARDKFFISLLGVEGRPAEPWVTASLSLLNHPLRERYSVKYILPGLRALPEIQRNGDIFLPSSWCSALLSSHNSTQARVAVNKYFSEGSCSRMLKGKILQNVIPKYDFKRVLAEK